MNIKNPIDIQNIGDPYVLFYKGIYYLYATSHFNGFYCWKDVYKRQGRGSGNRWGILYAYLPENYSASGNTIYS